MAVQTVVLLSVALSFAQGDLYGPETPQDVAWVRVLNAGQQSATVSVGGSEVSLEPLVASPYLSIEPGAFAVQVEGQSLEVQAEAEQFLTVALLPGGPVVVADPALMDVSRGLLGLMNLSSLPSLSLLTPDGELVVEGVAPGEARAVSIGPAQTALEVSDGEAALASLDAHVFERSQAYTVVALDGDDGITLLLLTATTE